MVELEVKRRQVSMRLSEELTVKIVHLEKMLPGYRIDLPSMYKDAVMSAISAGIDRIYKDKGIPFPEIPKGLETTILATIKKAYEAAGIPLPDLPEKDKAAILAELKKSIT